MSFDRSSYEFGAVGEVGAVRAVGEVGEAPPPLLRCNLSTMKANWELNVAVLYERRRSTPLGYSAFRTPHFGPGEVPAKCANGANRTRKSTKVR